MWILSSIKPDGITASTAPAQLESWPALITPYSVGISPVLYVKHWAFEGHWNADVNEYGPANKLVSPLIHIPET